MESSEVVIKDDKPVDDITQPGNYSIVGLLGKVYNILFETEDEKIRRAVYEGNGSLVLDLLGEGQDILNKDKEGNSLLHMAVMGRQIGMISFLVNMGLNPNHVNYKGENILMLAIKLGFNDISLEIMQLKDFNYTITDLSGGCLLHYCARYGRAIVCNEILKQKVNINAVDFNYENALHTCCRYNSLNVARVLLIHGIRTTQRNLMRFIPLEVAVQMKQREMVKLIFIAMRGDNYYEFEKIIDDLMIGREDPIILLNKTPVQPLHYGEQKPILRQN